MPQSVPSTPIIERRGRLGMASLHRPSSRHALTLGDVEVLETAFRHWQNAPEVDAILIRATESGYCSGGDLQSLYEARLHGKSDYAVRFLDVCDRLNRLIVLGGKPVIAILDGAAFGGGPGIALLPRLRVATESFRLEFPACGLGFVPDGGGVWTLSRQEAGIGTHLALTGETIGPGEAAELDLITDFVPSARLPALIERLESAEDASFAALNRILAEFRTDAPAGSRNGRTDGLSAAFAHPTAARILSELAQRKGDAAAEAAAERLARQCPAALAATVEALRRAETLDVAACLDLERNLARHFLDRTDFYEGIRARLMDRSHPPVWLPGDIECINREMIEAGFAPRPSGSPANEESGHVGNPV
jgi:enoyl-CoA hydratase